MWAAAENNVDAIRALLRAGAEMEAYSGNEVVDPRQSVYGEAALQATKRNRMIGLLSAYHAFFDYGDQSARFTALHFAVRAGRLSATKVLLDEGADVNRPVALGQGGSKIGMSPLILATHNAHYEVAAYLLERGANVNANADNTGYSVLHQIARLRGPYLKMANPVPTGRIDSLELARRLLVRGANPNAVMKRDFQDGYRNRINWQGATPLMVAAKYIDLDLLRLLVAYGADPNVKTVDGLTPLMVAAGVSVWNPVRTLVQREKMIRRRWKLPSTSCRLGTTRTQSRGAMVRRRSMGPPILAGIPWSNTCSTLGSGSTPKTFSAGHRCESPTVFSTPRSQNFSLIQRCFYGS